MHVTRTASQEESDLLVTAAVMYYEHGASQKDIATRLGVSRPTVSRLLARARDQGIVRIEIVPPNVDASLPDRLRDRLGLRRAHIAPGRAAEEEPGPVLAEPLGHALDEAELAKGDVILVGWGRAVHSLSQHVHRVHPGVVVVPAMGGNASHRSCYQPNEIAREFAVALGARPRFIHAPALISPALSESLRAEAALAETMDLWDRAKVALVGVGELPKSDSGYAAAGFPVDDAALETAVGDVAGWSFAADGRLLPHPGPKHFVGVTPRQLRRIPHVIALASGVAKARAVIGAARAGLISVLVTDAATARAISTSLDAAEEARQ